MALAVSSSGRFGNAIGQGDSPQAKPVVWLGLIAASLVYALFVAVVWAVVARLSDRQATVVLGLVVGAAILAFLVAYPRYGAPADASGYGDADDALNILADSVTDGFDPYERVTYEDNVLSPMMGAGLVAVPFRTLFGSAAYQNPVWLLVAIVVLWRRWGGRVALALTVPVLSSLGFAEHFVLGGDYFISGVALALAAYAFLAAVLFAAHRLRAGAGPLALAVAVNVALWVPWWLASDGDYPPLDRVDLLGPPVARALALVILLGTLAWIAAGRIRRPDAGSPSDRLAHEGGLLALSGLPSIIWSPVELGRVVTYLWLSVPLMADAVQERLGPVDPPQRLDNGP